MDFGHPIYELFNDVEGFLFYENSKYVIDLGEHKTGVDLRINIVFENLIEKLNYVCYYDVELFAKKEENIKNLAPCIQL